VSFIKVQKDPDPTGSGSATMNYSLLLKIKNKQKTSIYEHLKFPAIAQTVLNNAQNLNKNPLNIFQTHLLKHCKQSTSGSPIYIHIFIGPSNKHCLNLIIMDA
jgi:hypothetical protein